ncbi:MAG TPA: cation transporter [Candidatus Dormibacteraeota bacterium]|nr:cation transporter [Candidatus Dormibacteraeota bacterium]
MRPEMRARRLLYATIAWNALTVLVSLPAAYVAGSVALGGFGLDSGIEVAASLVAVSALRAGASSRHTRNVRLIRLAFVSIAAYLVVQAGFVLVTRAEPEGSPVGIVLLAATVVVMTTLAILKHRVGRELQNATVSAEARVTLIDSADSALVLLALVLNAAFGLWWADPLGGLFLAAYSLHEAMEQRA